MPISEYRFFGIKRFGYRGYRSMLMVTKGT